VPSVVLTFSGVQVNRHHHVRMESADANTVHCRVLQPKSPDLSKELATSVIIEDTKMFSESDKTLQDLSVSLLSGTHRGGRQQTRAGSKLQVRGRVKKPNEKTHEQTIHETVQQGVPRSQK